MFSDHHLSSSPGGDRMEERLWEYLDGSSTPDETRAIESFLRENEVWKKKYHELLEVRELLAGSELDQPSLRFTRNVMEEISRLHVAPAARNYINKKIVWGIGFFFIAMILSILVFAIGEMNFSSGEPSVIGKNLNKVDFSKIFSNTWVNALMMVNVVLGLFLLDNYLNSRRKKMRKARH